MAQDELEIGPVFCAAIDIKTGVVHKPTGLEDRYRDPRRAVAEFNPEEDVIIVTSPFSIESAARHAVALRECLAKAFGGVVI